MNTGRVTRSAPSAIAVRRKSATCVPGHGKNHADHEGFKMAENIKRARALKRGASSQRQSERRPCTGAVPSRADANARLAVGPKGGGLRLLRRRAAGAVPPAVHALQELEVLPCENRHAEGREDDRDTRDSKHGPCPLRVQPLQGPDLRLLELPRKKHRGGIDKKNKSARESEALLP